MKKMIAMFSVLGLGLPLVAATTGSSEATAKELNPASASANVTLVADSSEDSWFSEGVYYLCATLTKNTAYTVWFEGNDSASIELDAYAGGDWFEEDLPWASFGNVEKQGSHYVCTLKASDWDSDDPSSWKYYFKLEGDVGLRTTFHIQKGEVSFLEEGLEENPKTLTFSTAERTGSFAITDEGSYYFKATLKAGCKYLIRTTTGTTSVPLGLSVVSSVSHSWDYDSEYASDESNTALVVCPRDSGTFVFRVWGPAAGNTFGIAYKSVPERAIADHPSTALVENEAQTFRPGRMVADANYFDDIIDECLFRFTAAAGERWIIDATGADRDVEMRLYDASGNVLKTNDGIGDGTHGLRIGTDVTKAGTYYVGVYDPALAMTNAVVCATTRITARRVTPEEDVVATIVPVPGEMTGNPIAKGAQSEAVSLTASRWTRTFAFAGRDGVTYRLATTLADAGLSLLQLKATVFRSSGTSETVVRDINGDALENVEMVPDDTVLSFEATANATYGIRLSVAEGEGLEFPAFRLCALGASETEGLGLLTVNIRGAASATWSLDSESVKYAGGASVLLPSNEIHTVKFSRVTGFSTPANEKVTILEKTVVVGTYSDTFDPKDDVYGGATKLSVSAKGVSAERTLWGDDGSGEVSDEADWFTFTAKDGVYFDFELSDRTGDAVFSIYAQESRQPADEPLEGAANVTNVSKLALSAGTYYLCVAHGTEANVDSSYTLEASSANVGAIKFAKASYAVKKNAGSVALTVNRTASEGRVRVRYATVAGTARPGERYVAQSGVLEWANGDKKAKTITVKLIPDLVAVYDGDTQFGVVLEAFPEEELDEDEYPAQITVDTCTVTVKESASSSVTTVEKAYAKTQPTVAKVTTENTVLRAGTFYGVLAEDGSALTNGFPALASVTLTTTVKSGKNDSLSAKIALAGKTYTFKTNTKDPEEWEELDDGYKRIVLTLVNKSPASTNELTITVKDGSTTETGAWKTSGGTAELVMTVPDAKGKGAQADIRYSGEIFRQNAKIDDYLKLVAETYYGYYTLALVPEGVSSADGIPAGNGYLTVKVDNKGTAKVTGVLADGTAVSASVTAAMIREDATSANGYAMYLPVFLAKSPYCFGGVIRLTAKAGTTLPDLDYVRVVDSTSSLVWNNDNAALTYYGEDGWRMSCSPVGGWYDTVMNLEAYYLNYALEVSTADIFEFPTELLTADYDFVTEVQPNGESASFANDVLSTSKKSLVKSGKLYDLVNSVNPCNVQVKLARATGIVTGSYSLWSASEDGTKQKEVTGGTHKGVLLLSRDDSAALDAQAISAGFCSAKVKLSEENAAGRTVTRTWTYSLPFNLLGVERDETDPWEGDQGWNPDWGEEPDL